MRVSREFLSLSTLALGFFFGVLIGYSAKFYSLASVKKSVAEKEVEKLEREVDLSQQIRILCFVMTMPENHETRAKMIKNTWGKRCNILYFVSTQDDDSLPTINVHRNESRYILWGKTKEGFRHAYTSHLDDADWFLKADDDTFVIVENLRNLLAFHDPDEPIAFGCRFRQYLKQGYLSGGAGYVLSREALKRFVEVGLEEKTNMYCKRLGPEGAEDVEMGKCLEYSKVTIRDSRDSMGRPRFIPFTPDRHLTRPPNNSFWFWRFTYYSTVDGPQCCSQTAISFHYLPVETMQAMEYFIYELKVVDPKWLFMQKKIADKKNQ